MRTSFLALATVVFATVVPTLQAQFNSGSTGSDRALNLTTPGTIIFDPKGFTPPLNPTGDNIFNFTTINIAAGVTVKLSSKLLTGPVLWLAQGAVTINGTIDLDGDNGRLFSGFSLDRFPSSPGAGGYGGGVGRLGSSPAQPGNGPGGGAAGGLGCVRGGAFTGNQFLVPLIGGSGGGGLDGGGGAGGGALLIASSTTITVNGIISANGGSAAPGSAGGGGSGGAIRLAANSISGSGADIRARAGGGVGGGGEFCNNPGAADGTFGLIRFETYTFTLSAEYENTPSVRATPFGVFPPSGPPPTVQVVSVNGVPVPPSPTGSFTIPDVTINSSAAVPFVIQAHNVPAGTVVKLQILSDNAPDQTATATLAGTLALSTATASLALPPGFSRGFVKATWTQ